jgi:uncharacterized protein
LLVLLVVLAVLWFKRKAAPRKPPSQDEVKPAEDMVRCQVCGVNLPRSEAILSQGRFFCSDEHRLRG